MTPGSSTAYAATTFILAAPVVNPVVLVSTAVAFQSNWTIVGLRMAMTLSVAVAVGLLASALFPHVPGLVPAAAPISGGSGGGPHPGGGHGVIAHAVVEFYDVIFFILLGALFTAATVWAMPARSRSSWSPGATSAWQGINGSRLRASWTSASARATG